MAGYRNWLQLNQGTLAAEVTKGGSTFIRGLNPDRLYTASERQPCCPAGRCCSSARWGT